MFSVKYALRLCAFLAVVIAITYSPPSHEQTSPGFISGQTLTAAQLNAAFQNKQNFPITGSALPFPGLTTLGGVRSATAPANQFMTGISTAGVPLFGTPAGAGTVTSVGITVPTGLAISGCPITVSGTCAITWSGTIPNAQIPTPGVSSLGGVESATAPGSQFVKGINTSGQLMFGTPSGSGTVTTAGSPASGQCAEFTGTSPSTVITGIPCPPGGGSTAFADYVSIKTYGATGDGTCHQLSSAYANLAAAQSVYPFVSDLTQCIDWAAIQQAINISYTSASLTNGSFPVACPTGNYATSNPLIADTPTNGTAGNYTAWAAGTTYNNGANVSYNGLPWVSMGSGNVGNPPTAYDTFPAQMQLTTGGDTPPGMPWATVQISNASPAVITPLLGGGATLSVVANQPIVFFTQEYANPATGSSPALPTGINANQVYYVVGSSITGTTFQVSATKGGSAVNTSSAGTGHFFASGQVWQFAPIQTGNNFSTRISFIGDDGQPSNSGCQITPQFNWTSPTVIVGPGNGNIIKNISLIGPISASAGSQGANGYRCSAPYSLNGPAGVQVAPVGWAVMSNGGGASRTLFENVSAADFYINDWRSYGTTGELVDQNTWIKPQYNGACINIYMGSTQSFINTVYDGSILEATTNVVAYTQEGLKAVGGIYTTFDGLASTFTISSVSTASGCGFLCVTATLSADDNNFRSPMCGYSAAQAFHSGAAYLNAWPFSSGCGYNTFVINTTQWGAIGMYIMDYNPFTRQIVMGIPASYAGVYQGACCGTNLATQIAAATTLYAVESATMFFGDNQVEDVHVENDGVPFTLSCFCTQFFGGARPAEMKRVFLNAEASLGSSICCNLPITNQFAYQAIAQNTIPFINSTVGDTIVEALTGGNNTQNQATAFDMDRVLIATSTATYVEMRHTMGANNTVVSSGSAGNASGPLYDFMPAGVGGGFTLTTPLVNPTTLGQLSGGYYAMGGGAFGNGLWDNGSALGPSSQYSVGASNALTDLPSQWRTRGLGQAPQWGAYPAPWTNPCVLASQITTLGALPAITYIANLRDFVQVASGGSNYAVGNTITLAGGTFSTAAVLTVTSVSGGAVTGVQVQNAGAYTVEPAATFTQGSTSGSGSGATFTATGPIWYVNYNIGYPMLWGGALYKECNYTGASAIHAHQQNGLGYSYFQNLTASNVPHMAWTMDGASPFIYLNYEALELMFPGLVISLTGSGSCSGTQSFIVLETHPSLGYVKVVRADTDGSGYVPSLASSGTTCTGTTLGQKSPSLVTVY